MFSTGSGSKHVGDESFYVRAGDIAFLARRMRDHGLENASENEPLITVWGYTGAPSSSRRLVTCIPEDDAKPAVKPKTRPKSGATKRKPGMKAA